MALLSRLHIAGPHECHAVADLLTTAFSDSPLAVWLERDREQRGRILREHFIQVTAWHLENGTVYLASGNTATALWAPSAVDLTVSESVATSTSDSASGQLLHLASAARRPPAGWTCYDRLAYIAVDPRARRSGHARDLLAAHAELLDRRRTPAATVAPDPRTVDLLTASGFARGDVLLVEPGGPSLLQMLRIPRASNDR